MPYVCMYLSICMCYRVSKDDRRKVWKLRCDTSAEFDDWIEKFSNVLVQHILYTIYYMHFMYVMYVYIYCTEIRRRLHFAYITSLPIYTCMYIC